MCKTKGFKILMCLILTFVGVMLWMYVQYSIMASAGQKKYEGAVFVERPGAPSEEGVGIQWKL